MNKEEVQSRVLKYGKPLPLNKFEWDEKTRTFSSAEKGLVLDFAGVDDCTFKTVRGCTFKTGGDCIFNTGPHCIFETGPHCTFDTGWECTFKTDHGCVFKTGADCMFNTSYDCTFYTGWRCGFKAGVRCTFKAGHGCMFETVGSCTFDTGNHCRFDTGWDCTFETGWGCTFKTGDKCVIVRRETFEVIQPAAGTKVQLCPYKIAGHLVDGKLNGVPHVIADGVLSRIVSKKGGVYKVVNHGEEDESWVIQDGENFAHGATLAEARESLIYKAKDRDTSAYEKMTLDTVFTLPEAVKMYRTITGACASGTRSFVEARSAKERYSVREILAETRGRYGNEVLEKFLNKC